MNLLNDIIFPWINFFLLVGLGVYFLKKPARDFFLTRSKKIAQEVEQAAHEKQEVEARYLNYERRLKNVEAEIEELMQSLKKEGELARQKIIEEAQISSRRMQEVSKWIANQEIRKAREHLKEEIAQRVAERAGRFLREQIKGEDRERLAADYLKRLGGLV